MEELKTLKDFWNEGSLIPRHVIEETENIAFSNAVKHIENIKLTEIKQEVIKWVKNWQSDERLGYPTATIIENAPLAMIQLALETKISEFKHFFNITEDDLK